MQNIICLFEFCEYYWELKIILLSIPPRLSLCKNKNEISRLLMNLCFYRNINAVKAFLKVILSTIWS